MEKTCKYCNYVWNSKVDDPVSCPKCKRRFDYESTPRKLGKDEKK